MTYEFGDVVVVDFPFTDGSDLKRRPAVVISSFAYNAVRRDAIMIAVTSQLKPVDGELEALIAGWAEVGLAKPSALKPILFSLEKSFIRKTIGRLGDEDMARLRGLLARVIG